MSSSEEFRVFLGQYIEQLKTSRPLSPNFIHYSCVEEFVLKNGSTFTYQPLPKQYPTLIPQACFGNAFGMALEHKLIYVEGYACLSNSPMPILHAWCVDPQQPQKVIDPTTKLLRGYLGIPFRRVVLHRHLKEQDGFGESLLDDWKRDWPLLQLTPQKFQNQYLLSLKG